MDALCYSAYTIRNNEYIYQANENKLMNVLKAYHYEFTRFKYEETNNIITLNINLKNISRSEIRDNLIPLLENIIDNKFMIEEDSGNSLGNSFHRLKLKTVMPYKVETSGSSLKNYNQENGDNYSIFNYKQYAVCIISDGMGNSLIANETSRCITNIFQRMIQSNIAIDQAIKCINKLIHSDEYATVDIISFDQINGKAYICKSAACPTYLIRDNKIIKIDGASLPVGIINEIQLDMYIVDIKINDYFLMISDGVEANEVEEWIKTTKEYKMKNDINTFINILENKQRKDASTILLALVK
ncbi:MAG: SpoIIE family protein phosphatase [Erysipelotrichaceae bacterium]